MCSGITLLFWVFVVVVFKMYLFLAELDLHFFVWVFASCSEWGLLSCDVRSSHCGGFSCFGAQALELRLQ